MQQIVISRLELADKRTIKVNDPWLFPLAITDEFGKTQEVPAHAVVGAIYFIPAFTKIESWVEEEEEEYVDAAGKKQIKITMVTVTESRPIPAHFEVWALPDEKSLLRAARHTRRLRIPAEQAIGEEDWPLDTAMKMIESRDADAEIPDGFEDDAPDEPSAPVVTAPS
jgi:hypothetical protein